MCERGDGKALFDEKGLRDDFVSEVVLRCDPGVRDVKIASEGQKIAREIGGSCLRRVREYDVV